VTMSAENARMGFTVAAAVSAALKAQFVAARPTKIED
jgi:adenine/guanine phosphoribosyltransferase-like PRPP-binding protein